MEMIPPLTRYLNTARRAGVASDQVRNFRLGHYCPQPKQLAFHRAAREADAPDSPTQIASGGARGGAKSHAAVCQVVLDDCERVPGSKWLFLRSVGKSARESFGDFLSKALPQKMQYYVATRSALELPNGSRVLLGGFRNERDIDSYVGLEYDGILIDDAHLIGKAKYDLVRGSLRTSKTNWRPRTYVTFNPGGVGHSHLKHLFVEPWRRKQETDTRFSFSLPEDNAFLNPEYVQYLESLSGWLYKAWRQGDFDIAAGQFFTTWRDNVHVIEPFHIATNWRVWLAMDYAFTHWNVVYLMAEDNDGNVFICGEHAQRKWLVPRHAQGVRAMLDRFAVGQARIWKFVAGADVFAKRGVSERTIADQWGEEGFKLAPANDDRINGAAEMLRRLGDVDAGIAPTLYVFNTCPRLIECLPSMEHDPHRPEDVLKTDTDDDGNGGDDFFDAARYGLMAIARKPMARMYAGRY